MQAGDVESPFRLDRLHAAGETRDQNSAAMADRAKDCRTGQVIDAMDLRAGNADPDGPWTCAHCGVAMIPVACGRGQYKVAPHFRVSGRHEADCVEAERLIVREAAQHRPVRRQASLAGDMPSLLVFRKPRPQRPDGTHGEEIEDAADVHAGRGKGDASGVHGPTTEALRWVAQAYVDHPLRRHLPLRAPDCEGDSYDTCFQELPDRRGIEQFPYQIMYAPIRFRGVIREKDAVTLRLDRMIESGFRHAGGWRHDLFYQIRFPHRDWTEPEQEEFSQELKAALGRQWQNHRAMLGNGRWDSMVYVFFMGEQRERLREFVVTDFRHFCFLDLDHAQREGLPVSG